MLLGRASVPACSGPFASDEPFPLDRGSPRRPSDSQSEAVIVVKSRPPLGPFCWFTQGYTDLSVVDREI